MTTFSAATLNLGPGSPSRLTRLLGDQRGRVGVWMLQESRTGSAAETCPASPARSAWSWSTAPVARDSWLPCCCSTPTCGSWSRVGAPAARQGPRRQGQGPVRGFGCWSTAAQAQVGHRREAPAPRDGLPAAGASAHWPASQYMPRRAVLARRMSEHLAAECDLYQRAFILVGADFNATPGAKTLSPLRHKGWHLSQEQTPKPIPTHGKRPIDGFAWRQGVHGRAEFPAADTLTGIGSDHLPYGHVAHQGGQVRHLTAHQLPEGGWHYALNAPPRRLPARLLPRPRAASHRGRSPGVLQPMAARPSGPR